MDVPLGKPDNVIWAATALNTPIFLQVWKHVLRSGAYRRHEWTVKTEVDVVFSGSHLRSMLMASGHAARAVLVLRPSATMPCSPTATNTASRRPIEALTRKAVDAIGQHFGCANGAAQPEDGEDWWIEKCSERASSSSGWPSSSSTRARTPRRARKNPSTWARRRPRTDAHLA